MEDIFCAPMIITTICRYEHFKQCIESLARCTWADKTDVYVGLDYPTKDSHWPGYKKIRNYLESCTLKFKSLNVVVREKNYGLGVNGNLYCLRKQIFKQHDRVIISEDDNIFSPNFLVFINKGLKEFENDKSVFAINGYRHFYPIKRENNTFIRQNGGFSAWGYGIWRDRYESRPSFDYFAKSFTLKRFINVKKNMGNNWALDYWTCYLKPNQEWSDVPLSIYVFLKKMNIISPAEVSLVRNMGWDGSGENYIRKNNLNQKFISQKISDDKNFNFIGTGFEFYKENQAVFKKHCYAKISELLFWIRFCKCVLKFFLIKIFPINQINGKV